MKKAILILMALIFWIGIFANIIYVGPLQKIKSIRSAILIANRGYNFGVIWNV